MITIRAIAAMAIIMITVAYIGVTQHRPFPYLENTFVMVIGHH